MLLYYKNNFNSLCHNTNETSWAPVHGDSLRLKWAKGTRSFFPCPPPRGWPACLALTALDLAHWGFEGSLWAWPLFPQLGHSPRRGGWGRTPPLALWNNWCSSMQPGPDEQPLLLHISAPTQWHACLPRIVFSQAYFYQVLLLLVTWNQGEKKGLFLWKLSWMLKETW